ncbi:MAG: peptidylprolyl isomerase [SAR324 cluster bacterium]|nr:peptidylprolyl isomerase [SAR324 cluster bacterium]
MKYLLYLFFFLFSLSVSASTEYDRIRIIVNDRIITQNEIEIRLSEFIKQNSQAVFPDDKIRELRFQMTDLLIEELLLELQADELKIGLTEAQLDAEVDNYRKQNGLSQIEFEELLERRQLTLTDFKKSYLKRTQRTLVINREIRSLISISDDELKVLYEKGEGKIVRVHARHILLVLKQDASLDETQKIKQKINWIKKEIQAGKSFTEMADLHSQDPSVKKNHGDLGFFGKNDMVREFAEASFSLNPGTLSEPVRSPFGFHLIEVLEKKEDPQESFDKVKPKLQQQVYQKIFEQKYPAYIKSLKQKARIIRQ